MLVLQNKDVLLCCERKRATAEAERRRLGSIRITKNLLRGAYFFGRSGNRRKDEFLKMIVNLTLVLYLSSLVVFWAVVVLNVCSALESLGHVLGSSSFKRLFCT
jgi:hypothetical protein